jgi:hypothetical protein
MLLLSLGVALALFAYAQTKSGAVYIGGAADTVFGSVRGLRNNNPGNIRLSGDQWQGMSASQTDGTFVQFDSMVYGIRAIAKVLQKYHYTYGLNSVNEIIARWAPQSENNTSAYAYAVADYLGVSADDYLDFSNPSTLFDLVKGIIRHENGLIASALIPDSTINDGLVAANT